MSKSFTNSMFESIKESLSNQKNTSGGGYRDLLKTKVGNSYVVRLIPNTKNPGRTFHHYYFHGWKSYATGQYQDAICPTTWGDRCPICEQTMKLWNEGSDEAKKLARDIKRNEKWLVNVYVVDDSDNADNNDTIKIFRYGKQIDEIITEAIEGDDAEEFGPRIFDLTKEGCNLRIKVEKNEGGYPSYTKSKFLSKSEIEGLDAEKIKNIQDELFELDKIFEVKTREQLEEMLNDHFHCKPSSKKSTPPVELPEEDEDEDDEPIIENDDDSEVSEETNDENLTNDEKLQSLIADLD